MVGLGVDGIFQLHHEWIDVWSRCTFDFQLVLVLAEGAVGFVFLEKPMNIFESTKLIQFSLAIEIIEKKMVGAEKMAVRRGFARRI